VLPKKNPTAQGNGLSSDSANAVATTFPDCSTSGLIGRTQKVRPVGSWVLELIRSNQSGFARDDAVLPVRRRLFLVSVQGVKHSAAAGEFNRQNIGVMG